MTHFILKPFLTIKYHSWTTGNSNNSSATEQMNTLNTEKENNSLIRWVLEKHFFNEIKFFQRI